MAGPNRRYTELRGVFEVVTLVDEYEHPDYPREDLYIVQEEFADAIPEHFCKKDNITGRRREFFCQLCECPLMSVATLETHRNGKKHTKKYNDFKRQTYGASVLEVPAPRVVGRAANTLRPAEKDPSIRLKDLLKNVGDPVLGLEYVEEVFPWRPRERDEPAYRCTLDGCKGAWGKNVDMANHVKNPQHLQRAMIKKGACTDLILQKHEILQLASDLEDKNGGPRNRNYNEIKVIEDDRIYRELKSTRRESARPKPREEGRSRHYVDLDDDDDWTLDDGPEYVRQERTPREEFEKMRNSMLFFKSCVQEDIEEMRKLAAAGKRAKDDDLKKLKKDVKILKNGLQPLAEWADESNADIEDKMKVEELKEFVKLFERQLVELEN